MHADAPPHHINNTAAADNAALIHRGNELGNKQNLINFTVMVQAAWILYGANAEAGLVVQWLFLIS